MKQRKLPNLDIVGLAGCYVAGGACLSALTKQPISDYDIYPKNKEAFLNAIDSIMSNGFLCNASDKALTFKLNELDTDGKRIICQVMMNKEAFYPTTEIIFESFDFSVCMIAFDCDTKEYSFGERTLYDIASRTLVFNPKTRYPVNSMVRTAKYKSKGYFISRAEIIRISVAIMQRTPPSSWGELESYIGGSYGKEVRLQAGSREFTLDAALSLLEDFDVSFYMAENEKLVDYKADDLLALFGMREGADALLQVNSPDVMGGGTEDFRVVDTLSGLKNERNLRHLVDAIGRDNLQKEFEFVPKEIFANVILWTLDDDSTRIFGEVSYSGRGPELTLVNSNSEESFVFRCTLGTKLRPLTPSESERVKMQKGKNGCTPFLAYVRIPIDNDNPLFDGYYLKPYKLEIPKNKLTSTTRIC